MKVQQRPENALLLTPEEMDRADRLTIEGGVSGFGLMKAAGGQVAEAALEMVADAGRAGRPRIACLAGPGNNGGDAFVAAEILRRRGFDVSLFLLGEVSNLSGDAAEAARFFEGPVAALDGFEPTAFSLMIDGLFGAGLSRPLEGAIADLVDRTRKAGTRVLSIDLPSGVSGDNGQMLGTAFEAERTVSFFRAKPGHYLEPGRSRCGSLDIRQIGIDDAVLATIDAKTFVNVPALWLGAYASPSATGHKYDRGHGVVFSGPAAKTGAARLAAGAALRAGAGLVTVFSPPGAVLVNAAHLTAVMLQSCRDAADLEERLADERLNAFVLGPGFGAGQSARDYAARILEAGRRLVLDADGITAFAEDPDALFALSKRASGDDDPNMVLTPHAGEFKRLFPDLAADEKLSKPDRARQAAARSGAVIVLKGSDTVIAAPDGRAAINATGTPWLATAGTGDVLTGIILARLATGMPAFEAACAGVWMHGKAAEAFGPGLIAEDLAGELPAVFKILEELSDAG